MPSLWDPFLRHFRHETVYSFWSVQSLVNHLYTTSNRIYTEPFESLSNNDLAWQPSQKAAYSNSGFIVLGFVLEKVTSMEFKDILSENISKPLDLCPATGFELQDSSRAVLPPDVGFELISLPLGNCNP